MLKAEPALWSSFGKASEEAGRWQMQESRVSKSTCNEVFVFKGQEAAFVTTAVDPRRVGSPFPGLCPLPTRLQWHGSKEPPCFRATVLSEGLCSCP